MDLEKTASDFALEEYKNLFELIKIHFDSIKNLFRLYMSIIIIPFTVIALIHRNTILELKWTVLGDFVLGVIVFIWLSGIIIFRICIEHRIKTILYVHCINSIRRYFVDKDGTHQLREYLLLSTDGKFPPFFSVGRDYFWETSLLAILNSAFLCVIVVNIVANWVWGVVALIVSILFHILWYWKACEKIGTGK
jgi:hypothetical protein